MYDFTTRSHPAPPTPAWGALTRVASALWRVADRGGRVVGHVRAVDADGRLRYRAERFHATARVFHFVGEFADARSAVESLRG